MRPDDETESAIFETIRAERGGVAEIHSAFARFPEGVAGHYALYRKIMLAPEAPLSRWEREYLALATSRVNACPYCIGHHESALEHAAAASDRPSAARIAALEALAGTLTLHAHRASLLKSAFLAAGYSPGQWEHAVMVVSYYNFANRLAHAMGLELEPGFERTCET